MQPQPDRTARRWPFVRSVALLVALVAGMPLLLVRSSRALVGSANPLRGAVDPSHWRLDALGDRLEEQQLVDLLGRLGIATVWCCLVVVLATTLVELRVQRRDGAPMRPVPGFGWSQSVARHLAAGLLSLVPLTAPASAYALPARPATTSVLVEVAAPGGAMLERQAHDAARATQATDSRLHRVAAGESIYSIASDLARGDAARIGSLADWIVERNLGRLMDDGRTFTNAALVEVGWTLEVPVGGGGPLLTEVEHVVVPGDSYWRIADDRLDVTLGRAPTQREVLRLTDELMELNAPRLAHDDPALLRPGEIVMLAPPAAPVDVISPAQLPAIVVDVPPPSAPPVSVPAPVAASAPAPTAATPDPPSTTIDVVAHPSDAPAYIALGVSASALLSAGALTIVEARRRRQLRAATVGSRLEAPSSKAVRVETTLRTLDRRELVARLDVVVRAATAELVDQHRHVVAAVVHDDGAIDVMTDAPATPTSELWRPSSSGWTMEANVSLERIAPAARRAGMAHPTMVQLGDVHHGSMFVDLEALGLLCVDGPPAASRSIARAIAGSLAVSPFGGAVRIVTTGLGDDERLRGPFADDASTIDEALDLATASLGSTATAAVDGLTTFELRVRGNGESWDPAVVISVGHDIGDDLARDLIQLTERGGRGLAVVMDRAVDRAPSTLRAASTGWVLEPFHIEVVPIGLGVPDVEALRSLVDPTLDAPLAPTPVAPVDESLDEPLVVHPWREPDWSLMVRVLGPVEVVERGGTTVAFERSKAAELVAWLSQHRDRPSRIAARTALWDVDVRDATFANVVSDARRAMARAIAPPQREEWVGRTLTEVLPLHPMVVTDAELLEARSAHARACTDDQQAIEVLRPGLAAVRDLPFAGTPYLWPDAEGITSSLILLVTSAATAMAVRCLRLGDVDGVFWATGQGLRALPGHEELIALRMRAHARSGDLAAVRGEWASYERALHGDAWSSAEPSPKLVAIRRELLAPTVR